MTWNSSEVLARSTVTNHYTILSPAVLLASWTTIFLWGPGLVGFLVSIAIGVSARKTSRWTATRMTTLGTGKSGTRISLDPTGLLEAPMIFYILSIALAITSSANRIDCFIGWLYVTLRIAYNLSQVAIPASQSGSLLFFASAATQQVFAVRCLFKLLVA